MKIASHGYTMSAARGHHGNGMKAVGLLDAMQKVAGKNHGGKAGKKEKTDEVTISNTARSLASQGVVPSGGLQATEGGGGTTASAGGQHAVTISKSSDGTGQDGLKHLLQDIGKMQSGFDKKTERLFKAFDKGRIDTEQFFTELLSMATKQAEGLFATLKDLQSEVSAPSEPAAAPEAPASSVVPEAVAQEVPDSPVVTGEVAAGDEEAQVAAIVAPAVSISDNTVESASVLAGADTNTSGVTDAVLSALADTIESVTATLTKIAESDADDDEKALPVGLVDTATVVKTPPGLVDNPAIEKPPGLVDNPAIEEPPGLIDNPSVVVSPELVDTVESKDDETLTAETEDALAEFMDLFEEYEDFFSLFADQINAESTESIFDFVDTLTQKLEELEQAYKISTVYLHVAEDNGITLDLSLDDMVKSLMDEQEAVSTSGRFVGINSGVMQTGLPGAAGPAVHVGDTESGTQGSQQVFRMSMNPMAANQRPSFGFKDHDPLAAYRQTQFVAATTSVISNMSAYA